MIFLPGLSPGQTVAYHCSVNNPTLSDDFDSDYSGNSAAADQRGPGSFSISQFVLTILDNPPVSLPCFSYLLYAHNTTDTRPFWALEPGTLAAGPVTPLWLLGLLGTAQVRNGDMFFFFTVDHGVTY